MSIGTDPIGSYSIGGSSLDDVSSDSTNVFVFPKFLYRVPKDSRIAPIPADTRVQAIAREDRIRRV